MNCTIPVQAVPTPLLTAYKAAGTRSNSHQKYGRKSPGSSRSQYGPQNPFPAGEANSSHKPHSAPGNHKAAYQPLIKDQIREASVRRHQIDPLPVHGIDILSYHKWDSGRSGTSVLENAQLFLSIAHEIRPVVTINSRIPHAARIEADAPNTVSHFLRAPSIYGLSGKITHALPKPELKIIAFTENIPFTELINAL